MSWFHPLPPFQPMRLPRQIPRRVVKSFIGESGQVLNLLMFEGGGDVLHDSSPYSNHGKIVASDWRDGSWGWCLETRANEGYVEVPNSPSLDVTTDDLTFVAWVYVYPDQPTYGSIACKGEWGTDGYGYGAEQGVKKFCFYDRGRMNKFFTTLVFENERWYCFGVSRSGLDVKLYVNGELDSTHTLAGDLISSPQPFMIGGYSPPVTPYSHIRVAMMLQYKGVAKPDSWHKKFFEETRVLFGV